MQILGFNIEVHQPVKTVKSVEAADSEGNWNTHLCTVQELLPLFRAANSINYLRYALVPKQQYSKICLTIFYKNLGKAMKATFKIHIKRQKNILLKYVVAAHIVQHLTN